VDHAQKGMNMKENVRLIILGTFFIFSVGLIISIAEIPAPAGVEPGADQGSGQGSGQELHELTRVVRGDLPQRASRGRDSMSVNAYSLSHSLHPLIATTRAEEDAIRERIHAGEWDGHAEQVFLSEAATRNAERIAVERAEAERIAAEQHEAEHVAAAEVARVAAERASAARSEQAAASAGPAAPAPAAAPSDGSVWDRLAQCESGGRWGVDTGNGYFGGLQFSLSSWQAVGGSGYPHEHSRETQIGMGERLRGIQGWGAWPSCSRKLGLR
jgi:hypothetical protein